MTHENKPEIKIDYSLPLKNPRHEAFCRLYVTSPFDLDIIYRDAGYKCSTPESDRKNAWRLLRVDAVRQRVKWLNDERNERMGLDGDNVIRGLYETRDKIAHGEVMREMCIVYKIDVQGFTRISELLAKYHNLLTDKVDVNVNHAREEKIEELADDIISTLQQGKDMRRSIAKKKTQSNVLTEYPVDEDGKVEQSKAEVIEVRKEDIPTA